MQNDFSTLASLIQAVDFAAGKHRDQRRKDAQGTPYINHPIRVAALLADVGGINDIATLQAALLHDTIEDTDTTTEELQALFGPEVRALVQEVTDDKSLPESERKRLQIEHAAQLSPKARHIKLADKIANVTDLTWSIPVSWPVERKVAYLNWAEQVVAGCRGGNAWLDTKFDKTVKLARSSL